MARRACLFMILSAAQALLLAPRIAPRLSAAAMHRQSGRTSTVHALMPLSPETVDLGTVTAVADAAERLTDEAIRAANGELGWWGTYIKTVEDGIFTLHDFLSAQGAPYPYGLSIFLFVVGVKLVTLPLNWQQLSSAAAMKELKPQQDLVRKWYGDNKDLLNIEIGALFEKNNVNPLAGCLPSLAQIPVFLGVYYSVTSIAKAKIFSEGFLWIPNLSGPIADRTEGLSWLTEGWVNGAPMYGWADTLAYLSIPAILVVTQTVSLYLLGSFEALEESDSSSATAALALRILPFLLGWFALNAPSGLGLYWVFNNILTTATTVGVKKIVEKPPADVSVNVALLGPRRETMPVPELSMAPDWVKRAAPPAEEGAEEGAEGAEGAAAAAAPAAKAESKKEAEVVG